MSELEQGIKIEITERQEKNPINGRPITVIDYVGSVTIVKNGRYMIQDKQDEDAHPTFDKEIPRHLKRHIRRKVVELALEDLKTESTEFNKENCVYEAPLLDPSDIILHPIKMHEFIKNGLLEIILSTKRR